MHIISTKLLTLQDSHVLKGGRRIDYYFNEFKTIQYIVHKLPESPLPHTLVMEWTEVKKNSKIIPLGMIFNKESDEQLYSGVRILSFSTNIGDIIVLKLIESKAPKADRLSIRLTI